MSNRICPGCSNIIARGTIICPRCGRVIGEEESCVKHDFCDYQNNCICRTCKHDGTSCCQSHPQIDCICAPGTQQECSDYERDDASCS